MRNGSAEIMDSSFSKFSISNRVSGKVVGNSAAADILGNIKAI